MDSSGDLIATCVDIDQSFWQPIDDTAASTPIYYDRQVGIGSDIQSKMLGTSAASDDSADYQTAELVIAGGDVNIQGDMIL
jgi:hypothetical protein